MVQTADFVIIGGGMAGVSLGAELSKDASVIILEAEKSIGYHSTGRSAAIYIKNYGNETLRALNAVSEPFFIEPAGVNDSSLLSPRGELMFARDFELDTLNQYLEGSTGMDVISAKEAGELVPALKIDTVVKAVYEATAQDIDVDRMLQGYLKLFRYNGSTLITDAAVQSAKRVGDCWSLITSTGEIEGRVVINAAGAWADKVAEIFGAAKKDITPMRRSAALLPKPDYEGFEKWPLLVSASETFYAKPEAGLLMVSPADEDPVEPHDAWPEDMVLAEGLYRFEEAVDIPVQRVEHSWAGLRSFAPDRTPLAGFANDVDGFFWLAGQGGYGIQTAPALSQLAANLCLGRDVQVSESVIKALDPNRF